tara:strand:- start:43 stop:606 length:564 start_codon:yes stop_codon:yes gene_type:complete
MKKEEITFKYLKKNINLKKLINALDKVNLTLGGGIGFTGDNVIDKVIKSCPAFMNEKKSIAHFGYEIYIDDLRETNLCELSIKGQMLNAINKNFNLPEDTTFLKNEFITDKGWIIYNCIYSKINKTFYLQVCEHGDLNYDLSIIFKSKNKQEVFDKMKQLGELTKNMENISSEKTGKIHPNLIKVLK